MGRLLVLKKPLAQREKQASPASRAEGLCGERWDGGEVGDSCLPRVTSARAGGRHGDRHSQLHSGNGIDATARGGKSSHPAGPGGWRASDGSCEEGEWTVGHSSH